MIMAVSRGMLLYIIASCMQRQRKFRIFLVEIALFQIRKLRQELEVANEKISSLTVQLDVNVNVHLYMFNVCFYLQTSSWQEAFFSIYMNELSALHNVNCFPGKSLKF